MRQNIKSFKIPTMEILCSILGLLFLLGIIHFTFVHFTINSIQAQPKYPNPQLPLTKRSEVQLIGDLFEYYTISEMRGMRSVYDENITGIPGDIFVSSGIINNLYTDKALIFGGAQRNGNYSCGDWSEVTASKLGADKNCPYTYWCIKDYPTLMVHQWVVVKANHNSGNYFPGLVLDAWFTGCIPTEDIWAWGKICAVPMLIISIIIYKHNEKQKKEKKERSQRKKEQKKQKKRRRK